MTNEEAIRDKKMKAVQWYKLDNGNLALFDGDKWYSAVSIAFINGKYVKLAVSLQEIKDE